MKKNKFNITYILSLAFVSAMGGLLFGYDWVVIGGAKPFYEIYFDITDNPSLQGWAMSSALLGCVLGAVLAGRLSDKYGRKLLLICSAVLFILSAYGTGVTNDFISFIIYRIIGGIGIGLASTLSPLYIAEVSPAKYRGRFVSINQLTIVIGILAAQVVNFLIKEPVAEAAKLLNTWNAQEGWRWMFWAELVPALVFFILIFLVPESPRFLAKNGQFTDALRVLTKIGAADYAKEELANIKSTLGGAIPTTNFREIKSSKVRPIVLIGVVLAVFQQWCGINVIFNYAQEVFQSAGYNVDDMFMNIVITGSVNLIFTFIAIRTVDKWGRRALMLFGAGGLAILYILIGSMYYFEFSGWPVLLLVVSAIAIYAMSLAPVTWVVLSEIFPNRIRGLAMSVATLALWISSFIFTYTFPILINAMGAYGVFWAYSGICLLGFIFIKAKLPETKNKSLEEIEIQFTQKNEEYAIGESLERESHHSNV